MNARMHATNRSLFITKRGAFSLQLALFAVALLFISVNAQADVFTLITGQNTAGNQFHYETESASTRGNTHAQDTQWMASAFYGDVSGTGSNSTGYAGAYYNGTATGTNKYWNDKYNAIQKHVGKITEKQLDTLANAKGGIGRDNHSGMPGVDSGHYSAGADVYLAGDKAYNNGLQRLVREGSSALVVTSTVGHYNGLEYYYNEATGNYTALAGQTAGGASSKNGYISLTQRDMTTGIMELQSGFMAFTAGFSYDPIAAFTENQYLNGYFSVLGALQGIMINGTLLNAGANDGFWMGDNVLAGSSWLEGSWDLELDLVKLFDASILKDGFNTISFIIDIVPSIIADYDGITQYAFYNGTYGMSTDWGLLSQTLRTVQNRSEVVPIIRLQNQLRLRCSDWDLLVSV